MPLRNVPAQITQPFQPTASAIRVNVMWILSLVLSLTCALAATLVQQWARRYLRLALRRGAPHKRARMRAYISDGIEGFQLNRAIEAIITLLHISVFLFFTGLVEFLFPINTTVAYVTLSCVTLFAFAYGILTILPNLSFNCPYHTPLSRITWRLYQGSIYVIFRVILCIEGRIHHRLLAFWRWQGRRTHRHETGDLAPTRWRAVLDKRVTMHRRWLSDGLGKSAELSATAAPPTVDAHALEWTLTALDEDKEIEDFAARVPGFFESSAVPDPASAILPLMSDHLTTDPILGSRLSDLLKTCIPGTSPLTEEKRKIRLRVCLKCLWCCGKAYNERREPLPDYFRVAFASPEMTHQIQAEQDLAARVIGSCFRALVAKKLSADINPITRPVTEGILACLSGILGTESREVMSLLSQPGAIDLASIISIILEDADMLVGDAMPSDVLDVFTQTLKILSQTFRSRGAIDMSNLPLPQVAQFHEIYSKAPHWLKLELQEISDRLPPISSYAPGEIAFPEPNVQGSWTNISHVSQQSRENQGRIDSGVGDDLAWT